MSQCLKYIVSYIHCRFIVNCAWTILKQQFTRCKGFRTHPNFSAGEVIQHKACHHTDFSASTRQLSPRCILSLSWARCCAVIVTVIASLQSAISCIRVFSSAARTNWTASHLLTKMIEKREHSLFKSLWLSMTKCGHHLDG